MSSFHTVLLRALGGMFALENADEGPGSAVGYDVGVYPSVGAQTLEGSTPAEIVLSEKGLPGDTTTGQNVRLRATRAG